jgi:hypothetical protein
LALSITPLRSCIFPLLAMSIITPGCGNRAMSGRLLPWTRVLTIVSKDCEASENLMVTPLEEAHSFSPSWNPLDWSPPKPNRISTWPSPSLAELPPPPPPDSLRHAEANSMATAATANPWNNLRHRILSPFR